MTHELLLEAQGSQPNFNYDLMRPLLQGRVAIEGVTLRTSGQGEMAGFFENPKFRQGNFDLLDTNWGDLVRAIDAGWDLRMLPVFIKRKPAYNYLWIRADRGIQAPRDLEGKTFATVGYGSAISTYTRGFLQHDHGVDIGTLRWLVSSADPFAVYDPDISIQIAQGPAKSPAQRLLDGEVDASTGDIVDPKTWAALEGSPNVRRMFPDYKQRNVALIADHRILTPVHLICVGGRLERADPGLARRVYEGFDRAREMAYEDVRGDQTSYSLLIGFREAMRDQLRQLGDVWRYGIDANRNAVERFLQYSFEQGLTKKRLTVEQTFAQGTLET